MKLASPIVLGGLEPLLDHPDQDPQVLVPFPTPVCAPRQAP